MEWQPIETALFDGTAIWLLIDGKPYIGYFDPYEAPWSKPKWFVKATFRRRDGYRRRNNLPDEIFCCNGVDMSPTHWMPLPEPPALNAAK